MANKTKGFVRKLFQEKNVFFSFTGIIQLDSIKKFYDPERLLRTCLQKYPNLKRALTVYDSAIKIQLKIAGAYIKKKYPKQFLSYFDNCMLSPLIVTFVNDKPYFKNLGYILKGNSENWIVVNLQSAEFNNKFSFLMNGMREHIQKRLDEKKLQLYLLNNMIPQLACAINIEAERNPEVGLPVDIAVIYKKGGHIVRDQNCR